MNRLLLSRRYAALALALLAGVLALSAVVPDETTLEVLRQTHPSRAWLLARLQPGRVAASPLFVALAAYVGLAIAASMISRIRAHLTAGAAMSGPRLQRFVARRTFRIAAAPQEAGRRINDVLRRAGFRAGPGLAGARGESGFWGSMLFHAGLLIGLAGIALSARGRFGGEVVLVEGFPLDLSPRSFLRASPPGALGDLQGTRLGVSAIAASYAGGRHLTDVSAAVEVRRGRATSRHFASVNVPFEVEGFQFTVHAYGWAPELEVMDERGRVRASGNAVLRVLPPGTRDALDLGDGGLLELRFYPDHALQDGRDASRTLDPVNPVLAYRWTERGAVVAEGRVVRGGTVLVAGRRVAFRGLAAWLDLVVARDPGLPWFAAGSLLGIAGLALRLGRYEQSWRARLSPDGAETTVELTVSSRYFPALLEQRASRLAAEIERA